MGRLSLTLCPCSCYFDPQAYSFLERKRDAAAEGCAAAAGGGGTCAELEKLNTMAHELLATGSVSGMLVQCKRVFCSG